MEKATIQEHHGKTRRKDNANGVSAGEFDKRQQQREEGQLKRQNKGPVVWEPQTLPMKHFQGPVGREQEV
jgi:hypothetical protein